MNPQLPHPFKEPGRTPSSLPLSRLPFVFGVTLTAALGALASLGASPISPDHPSSVQSEVVAAYQRGEKQVVIPPGTYRLPCPPSSPWHLRFSRMSNFIIDARGVTFLFTERGKRAMLFDDCQGVTFRGAVLNRETPPFSQGKVVGVDEQRLFVDIAVDGGYPADLDDKKYFPRIPVFTVYEKGSRKLKPLVPDIYVSKLEKKSERSFRFFTRGKVDDRIPLAVGDPVAWRGPSGCDLALWNTAKMVMDGLVIQNGTGLGFMELTGEGGNLFRRCTISYGPKPAGANEEPLLACGTDGLHSASMRVGPTMENCLFEGLNDDSVNIHGTYAMAMEGSGNKITLDWRSPHSGATTPFPFARRGDTLRFYDTHGALLGERRVNSVRALTNYQAPDLGKINSRAFSDRSRAVYWEVEMQGPEAVIAPAGGMVANAQVTGSGFVIRGCTFRNSRAHGIFIRASDGLIEGNTIESVMMAGILIAPEMNSWNESDYSRNLVIRSNTLRNVATATQPWNSGLTVAAFEYGGFAPLPGGHRDIVIEGNRFEDCRGPNLVLTSVQNLVVRGNLFIRPMNQPAYRVEKMGIENDGALFYIREASGIKLEKNRVESPGSFLKTLVDKGAQVTLEGENSGISQK